VLDLTNNPLQGQGIEAKKYEGQELQGLLARLRMQASGSAAEKTGEKEK